MKFFVFVLSVLSFQVEAQKVWVDTDIMTGKFAKDVDDGLALIMILENIGKDVAGISLINDVDYGQKVTGRILAARKYGSISVYSGAESKMELGKETEASKALEGALRREKLKIFGLGPATNIATVLKLHPELASQIDTILFCKGRVEGSHFQVAGSDKFLMDYNLEWDPEAMEIVLNSGVPLVLAGFPVAEQIHFTKKDILQISKEIPQNKWLRRQLKDWLFCWKLVFKSDYFIPFDAVTVGYFLHPEYFKSIQHIEAEIKIAPNDTEFKSKKEITDKPYLIVHPDRKVEKGVTYVETVDPEYKSEIISALNALK